MGIAHHTRGVAILLLFLRLLHLPSAGTPASNWRFAKFYGAALMMIGVVTQGVAFGRWLHNVDPRLAELSQRSSLEMRLAHQVFLSIGLALFCEGCRAHPVVFRCPRRLQYQCASEGDLAVSAKKQGVAVAMPPIDLKKPPHDADHLPVPIAECDRSQAGWRLCMANRLAFGVNL